MVQDDTRDRIWRGRGTVKTLNRGEPSDAIAGDAAANESRAAGREPVGG
jgi:hypothetical protein